MTIRDLCHVAAYFQHAAAAADEHLLAGVSPDDAHYDAERSFLTKRW
jgi:hypothetical protein